MTTIREPNWAGELVELLDRQRALYEQLEALSREQGELVESGEAEALLQLLSRRQALIDQLAQINADLEPYKQNWSQVSSEMDERTRGEVRQRVERVRAVLGQIMERDERDRQALSERRDQTQGQVRQTRGGAAVNKAYGAPVARTQHNRFMDSRG